MSIETRKARNQSYSTLAGIFKQYELVYHRRRRARPDRRAERATGSPRRTCASTGCRGRARTSRRFFLDYLKTMNEMRDHPEFLQHA